MFCKHQWEKISDTTTESKLEHSLKALKGSNRTTGSMPWQLADADRKNIQVFSCKKCPKLKRFVENI